jgi:RHS repeat-associated protein
MRGFAEGTTQAAYLYDGGGNRVKKVVWKSSSLKEVTVYIDGGFEYLYTLDGSNAVDDEYNEVHVMDGRSRVARVKLVVGVADEIRYNLEDHLGNSSFTMNGDGSLIIREEYFPFGETSFGSYALKRYRFCGKERDVENGLYYYGARYYAPWSCRFVSIDPLAGDYPFYTPYQYAGNQPINFIDLDGLEQEFANEEGEIVQGAYPKAGDENAGVAPVSTLPDVPIVGNSACDNDNASIRTQATSPQESTGHENGFLSRVGNFFSSIGRNFVNFTLVTASTIASNLLLGAARIDPTTTGELERSTRLGQTVGDAISIFTGLGTFLFGAAGGEAAVAAASETGGASLVLVPEAEATAVYGFGVTVTASHNLWDDLRYLFAKRYNNHEDLGGDPDKVKPKESTTDPARKEFNKARNNDPEAAQENLEGIEEHKEYNQEGINSIEGSKQKLKNALKRKYGI